MFNRGYQQITSLSSAQSLTVPDGASIAVVSVETKGVRWRDDGTNPTSSVGMPLSAGSERVFEVLLDNLKFIEQEASATLNVMYYSINPGGV
jgi:hypothetical protein